MATHHPETPLVSAVPLDVDGLQPLNSTDQKEALPNIRLLLVDDDPAFRADAAKILAAAAFTVDLASSSAEALEAVKQHIPDIILLDSVMKGINGFQACRLLKTDPALVDVPIIMSIDAHNSHVIQQTFAAGATDFILKPIEYPAFIQHLYFVIRAAQNTAELRKNRQHLATLTALTAAQRVARLGYWTWYIKTQQFQISAHLASLCGINLEQFDGTLDGFIQLVHPNDRQVVKNTISLALDCPDIEGIEYRLQVARAEPIFVHQELEAITDEGELIVTGTVQDISRQKETEKHIRQLAYYDNLTGLASRAYYHERIENYIKNSARRNQQFAYLFLDLDDFKDVNDHFGHHIGDQFLNAIAHRLKFTVREVDFIARLGCDEFCIILANINDDGAVTGVTNRCLLKVSQPLLLSDHHQMMPKVSIGIAVFPRDGDNESELIKAASTAMYSAKKAGKHGYVFHSHDMAHQAKKRREKEQMLRTAMTEKQFVLYYQPQLSMDTGQIVGMEALVRWRHPELGVVTPAHFISLLEQLGLLIELGDWAIHAACEQIADWHNAGLPYIQVAVNLAPAHFQVENLLETVQSALEKTGVPAKYLELEVTESAMQTKGSIDIFQQLRALGIKIAIDDFGTGFSCLASLKQLPLDCLKIDKIFIDDMLYNAHTSLLLGTIIGLANALDYALVAEGVETKDQALALQGLGCSTLQGFFFSPAVPAEDIPVLVNSLALSANVW